MGPEEASAEYAKHRVVSLPAPVGDRQIHDLAEEVRRLTAEGNVLFEDVWKLKARVLELEADNNFLREQNRRLLDRLKALHARGQGGMPTSHSL